MRSNSIFEQAADAVDVTGNSDRQLGLSALTTLLRRPHASLRYGKASSVALADARRNSADGGSSSRSRGCGAGRFDGGMEVCTGRRMDRYGVRLSRVDVDRRVADGR